MKIPLLVIASLVSLLGNNVNAKQLSLNLDKVSVSGISSGGYMANQFHLAHSDWVDKVGIIAAGPYFCAQNSIKTALAQCVSESTHNTSINLQLQAKLYEKANKIAPLDNLKNAKVWLFRGTKDEKIHPQVHHALYQQYLLWVTPANIAFIDDQPTAHVVPTLDKGKQCDLSVSPFLGNCGYDAASEMLNFLYPNASARVAEPNGQLIAFEQQKLGGKQAKSLADTGYVYIPQSCQQGQSCQLHINFHGCQQNAQSVGQQYVQDNGINHWAEANQIVVLYPQTKNSMFLPLNPQGCWDWWGYTGEDYATNQGEQIQAVKQMAQSLASQIQLGNE